MNDIYREVLANEQQLWIAQDTDLDQIIAAMTTKLIRHPQCTMLSGILAGGERIREWIFPMMDMFDIFAKENNCRGFNVSGRPGWEKILKELGMKKLFTTFEKEY